MWENLELTTIGSHQREHSKGYRDGYSRGLIDVMNKQIEELKTQNKELLKQIKLLQWQIKGHIGGRNEETSHNLQYFYDKANTGWYKDPN
jgi:cell division septum initiation protein DivIVA